MLFFKMVKLGATIYPFQGCCFGCGEFTAKLSTIIWTVPETHWLKPGWLKTEKGSSFLMSIFTMVPEEKCWASVQFSWLVCEHSSCLQMPASRDLYCCIFSYFCNLHFEDCF